MARSRPRYPAEYRRQMVDLVRSGRSPDHCCPTNFSIVGAALSVLPDQVFGWAVQTGRAVVFDQTG